MSRSFMGSAWIAAACLGAFALPSAQADLAYREGPEPLAAPVAAPSPLGRAEVHAAAVVHRPWLALACEADAGRTLQPRAPAPGREAQALAGPTAREAGFHIGLGVGE